MPDHAGLRRVSQARGHRADGALSAWNAVEERYESKRGLIDGRRLGCQAKIQGDMVIDVPPESQVHKQVVRKRAEARDIVLDPATRLYYVEVEEPDMHEPTGDLERLVAALEREWGLEAWWAICAPSRSCSRRCARAGGRSPARSISATARSAHRIVQVWPGFYEGSIYGLAFDIGSTTIVACHLCDLPPAR
jgi:uncharacterized 2Fe-2S/4Fe-4S cluster protein (DUF4445 family)